MLSTITKNLYTFSQQCASLFLSYTRLVIESLLYKVDEPKNTGSFYSEVQIVVEKLGIQKIIVTEPGEYRVLQDIQSWQQDFCVNIKIRTDDRFLATIDEFSRWAKDYKQLRMEYFTVICIINTKFYLTIEVNQREGSDYDSQNCKSAGSDIRFILHIKTHQMI